jgi:hypothetical protein
MMDLVTMARKNKKAEARARQPVLISKEQVEGNTIPVIPFTGEKTFAQWAPATLEEIDILDIKAQADSENPVRFFVDISGMGAENEPALTHRQLFRLIAQIDQKYPGQFGYGLSCFGELQGWVTVYKRKASRT